MYRDKLGYEINECEKGYYADTEDAYDMVKYFDKEKRPKKLTIEL